LRVLGIASAPADLTTGETATLSALVYAPNAEAVSYQWSWCPSRSGADDGFACLIDETELQAAWATLDTGITLPPYNLGTGETASLELVFEASQAFALCDLLTRDEPIPELALFTCLSGLGLSIELRVTTATEEVVALKTIPVVETGAPRNANPVLGPALMVSHQGGAPLATDEALRAEEIYEVVADVAPDQSETFLPEAKEGQDPPEARGETLFLSWFVTTGSTHRKGDERTSYFDGGDFEEFKTNVWDMDFDIKTNTARLFLVLRDERNGISWSDYSFALEEAR
jgi:hypothetical protein